MAEHKNRMTHEGLKELIAGIHEMSGIAQGVREIEAFGTVLARLEEELGTDVYPRRSNGGFHLFHHQQENPLEVLERQVTEEIAEKQWRQQRQEEEKVEAAERHKRQAEEAEARLQNTLREERNLLLTPDKETITSQTGWKVRVLDENTSFKDVSTPQEIPYYTEGSLQYYFLGITPTGELTNGAMKSQYCTFINLRKHYTELVKDSRLMAGIWNRYNDYGQKITKEDQTVLLPGANEHGFITTYVGFYTYTDTSRVHYFKIRFPQNNSGLLEITRVQPIVEN